MRLDILDKLHEGHQGVTRCRERTKTSVWWPGLSKQLEDLVTNCTTCARERPNHDRAPHDHYLTVRGRKSQLTFFRLMVNLTFKLLITSPDTLRVQNLQGTALLLAMLLIT